MTNQEATIIIGNLEDKDMLFNPCDVQDAKTMAIKALEQEPKTGHWIEGEVWEDTDGGWGRWQKCSVCRQSKHHKTKFCPNCGARMVEPQESEVEE